MRSGLAFGCGQCLPCRIDRKRIWTHRLILEGADHTDKCFVTLTYDDEHLPADNSLVPKHAQDWLKRLRKAVEPVRLRFFLVGEYGDRTSRPHYHVALYGYPPCHRGRTDHRREYCCPSCDLILRTWSFGGVDLGELNPESASYVAGYVTKKLTKSDEYSEEVLQGRHPEFTRMSRRPGIGGGFADEVASTLLQYNLDTPENIPTALRHGSRIRPLGKYLRKRIAERAGIDAEEVKKYNIEKAQAALQDLRESSTANVSPGFKAFAFQQALIDKGEGKRRRIEAMETDFKKKRSTL